ncbi:DUF5363 domain-containing protein [Conservatibacter flavescens]|uniref:DUF5363 domain-containing protein n=1 Tax=Conservatibacter flavescens TaxID=28161 RepID=A0A2M8S3B8_9PAST|nr:DUF5363 domain-containing protein [Conservatibacter flavescens]PJG85649.1 hypothetical protein CVP05_04660 [Conservatibacter flavescens]
MNEEAKKTDGNSQKKSWFRRALEKYDQFCKEAGIDDGACRSCMPIVKADENGNKGKSSV